MWCVCIFISNGQQPHNFNTAFTINYLTSIQLDTEQQWTDFVSPQHADKC